MIKVRNEKIELSIYKNGKFEKSYTFKNSLTNLFISNVMYYQTPPDIRASLFPALSLLPNPFYNVYFDFTAPKQNISISTETVNIVYDNLINFRFYEGTNKKYSTKGKQISTPYPSKTFSTTDKLQYLFFGNADYESTTMKLSSFIDVSSLNIYPDEDTTFLITRYDEIESNETGILTLGLSNDYLPKIEASSSLSDTSYIYQIDLCYEANGQNMSSKYTYSDLNWELIDSETIELTGFDDFYKGIFDYPQNDYPQDDYPQEGKGIKSVKFTYRNGIETYVNIEDLDITYNNKKIKIRLKCERGAY
jgi:hypothetical protein